MRLRRGSINPWHGVSTRGRNQNRNPSTGQEAIIEKIITRSEAQRIASKTYFTGEPCRRGHVSFRFTSSGSCGLCQFHTENERKKRLRSLTKRTQYE